MTVLRKMSPRPQPSDEELAADLAAGSHDTLAELYARHAPLVFGLASRALDRAAAEDLVQDVFLTVWRQAGTFDPERGPFRAWIVRITQSRIANELRRRRRRPKTDADADGTVLAGVVDEHPGPADLVWREFRRSALRAAFDELPPAQRKALGLAFFEDMTHEQVAAVLVLPLGTVKTRIRTGIQKLRGWLPQVATASLVVVLAVVGLRERTHRLELARDDRALALVTSSDTSALRLGALGATPAETHARYRGRTGAPIAVLTLSKFPPPPPGRAYQAWALRDGAWVSLGTVEPDATGAARVIVEGAEVATLPAMVEITVEPVGGSVAPGSTVVVRWPEP